MSDHDWRLAQQAVAAAEDAAATTAEMEASIRFFADRVAKLTVETQRQSDEIDRLRAEVKRRGGMLRRADKHIAFALSEYPEKWKSRAEGMALRDEIEALSDED